MPAPFVYLLVDLRLWLLALLALFVLFRWSPDRLREAFSRWWCAPFSSALTVAAAASVAVLWVTASTSDLRFTTVLHGDEPKYLRFSFSFYQGRGLDLTDLPLPSDIPVGAPPRLGSTLSLFTEAVRDNSQSLRRDLRGFGREGWSYRWNRARYLDNWFVSGKSGGAYQVHTPGLSFILLPGFALDMWLLRSSGGGSGQFSDRLTFTTLTLLVIYALWAAVMLRCFTAAAGAQGPGVALTAATMLTIPVAGMPFQIYPEVAAGLVIAVVVHHLLFAKAPTTAGALGAGLLAGFLPWLHVRFLAIWVLLVLCAPFFYPRSRLSRVFVGVAGLGLASLCVYAYHITGSFLPTAMYGAAGAPQNMEPHLIGPGLLGYLYDRDYGLLPYSPIYLLAIPCLLPWIRHERGRALFIIAIGLALAIPSAAHGWNSAGGTPLRHLTAIVPLAMLPLADAWRRGDRGRLFWIAALVLLFFSLQNAYAYNQFHRKDIGPMLDQSASGWKTLLLFPRVFAVEPMTRKTFTPTGLLYVWIAATAALAVAPLVTRESKGKGSGRLDAWPIEALTAAGILIVVLAGLAVSAWTGVATDASYMR